MQCPDNRYKWKPSDSDNRYKWKPSDSDSEYWPDHKTIVRAACQLPGRMPTVMDVCHLPGVLPSVLMISGEGVAVLGSVRLVSSFRVLLPGARSSLELGSLHNMARVQGSDHLEKLVGAWGLARRGYRDDGQKLVWEGASLRRSLEAKQEGRNRPSVEEGRSFPAGKKERKTVALAGGQPLLQNLRRFWKSHEGVE